MSVARRLWRDGWLLRALIGSLLLVAMLGVAMLIVTLTGGPVVQRVATTFAINLIIVLALQVFTGSTGIVSFGHAAFVGIGAYVTGLLMVAPVLKSTLSLPAVVSNAEIGLLPALLLSGVIAGACGFIIGIPLARLGGPAAAIATLAVLVIAHEVLQNWDQVTRGNQTFYGVPKATTLWAATLAAMIAIVVARVFKDSPPGLRLRASREDEGAAGAMGVRVWTLRLWAWTLSAAVAGVGGGLLAAYLTAYSPKAFYFVFTFNLIAMVIIGGVSTVTGAVAGAAIVTVALELLRGIEDGIDLGFVTLPAMFGLAQIALGVIFLLVLIFRPKGVMGRTEAESIFDRGRSEPRAGGSPRSFGDGDPERMGGGPLLQITASTGADSDARREPR